MYKSIENNTFILGTVGSRIVFEIVKIREVRYIFKVKKMEEKPEISTSVVRVPRYNTAFLSAFILDTIHDGSL